MKNYLLPVLLILVLGCSKNERANEDAPAPSANAPSAYAPSAPMHQSYTPAQTVLKVCEALDKHDSAAYLDLISASRKRAYAANPQLLNRTLAFWATRKPTILVMSASQHDTTATVRYRLQIAGAPPVDMVDSTQLFLENGEWKYSK
jgi:hypothetical protein